MTDDEVFDAVRQAAERHGCAELARVMTIKGFRRDPRGGPGMIDVTIEVSDSGNPTDPERFVVQIRDEDGRVAGGNGGKTIDEALHTTHWEKLDEDPEPS